MELQKESKKEKVDKERYINDDEHNIDINH